MKNNSPILGFLMIIIIAPLAWWGTTWMLENFDNEGVEPGSAKYHFDKSIGYKNQSTKILNQKGKLENLSPEDMKKVIDFRKKALNQARLVDADKFKPPFEDKFKNKYIKGLELFIQGYQEESNQKFLEGQRLLNEWGDWFKKERSK